MKPEKNPQRPDDLNLIERFISAYNTLDLHLQGVLGIDSGASFRSMVDLYAKRHKWFHDVEQLRVIASLRNVIVHNKIEPYQYPCVPTPETVASLESIRDRIMHPQRAGAIFRRDVVTVAANDSLSSVLRLIHHLEYSQFPVCESGRYFTGLLTENTITRWLAHRTATAISLIEFDEIMVHTVLEYSEKRRNYQFMAAAAPVEEIAFLFHENTYLEAVLITPHGEEREPLSGIVTRGDIMRWEG